MKIVLNVGSRANRIRSNNDHVRLSYNPYFSICFFIRNSVSLSHQISKNSVSSCFFSEANGANGFTSYDPTSPSTRVPARERILEVTSISYYLVYLTHRKITSIKYNFFLFTRFLTQYKH